MLPVVFGCGLGVWSLALWTLAVAVLLDVGDKTNGAMLSGRLRYMGDPETETDADARFGRHAHYEHDHGHSINRTYSDKKIYCGHRLVDHMRYICRGPSNGPPRMYGHGHRKRQAEYPKGHGDGDAFEESARNENIVNECCKKPCSTPQMKKYCGLYAPTTTTTTPAAAPEAQVRAESLVQEDEPLAPAPAPETRTPPPPPPAKGDEGLSPLPLMLQLQDWYGSPRSSVGAPARTRYVNFLPDYSAQSRRRRPTFVANQRRVQRVRFRQQGKPTSTNHVLIRPFQQAAPESDETERDQISREELMERIRQGNGKPPLLVSPYHSAWRTDEGQSWATGPVSFPIGFSDQFQTYYPHA